MPQVDKTVQYLVQWYDDSKDRWCRICYTDNRDEAMDSLTDIRQRGFTGRMVEEVTTVQVLST